MKQSRFHYAATERAAHGDLFDITSRKHGGNTESQAAFATVKDRLSVMQERVLRAIRESDNGLTTDEIAVKLGATPNEISPRCSELKRQSRIRKAGTRLTRGGCPAAILVIA